MTTTNFIDKQTVIVADWLNDVDAHIYNQDIDPHDQYRLKSDLLANNGSSLVQYNEHRTVQDKLGEIFSVKDFGAVGDGVTDDTAAILSAVAAIKTAKAVGTIGQATLYFPPTDSSHYYNITAPIVFEDMIQIEITGGQGAHIRNVTNDNEIFIFRGTSGFGNVFGFNVHNVFLSGNNAAGTKPVISLVKCILSWFTDIYVDTAPRDGFLIDPSSSENWFTNCIVESAYRDGFNITSDLNHFTNCNTLGCGQYGFNLLAGANENTFVGCTSYRSKLHGWSVAGDLNTFASCIGRNNSQNPVQTYSGMSLAGTRNVAIGCQMYDTQGTATQRYGLRIAGTSNKVCGTQGSGNKDRLLEVTATTALIFDGGIEQVSADRGDASVTLVVGVDAEVQRFATNLTAARMVLLSTAGAYNGAKFRIVRTGLGAYMLEVAGPGTLKVIPSATAGWVDVVYDGTAWRLTGYGNL